MLGIVGISMLIPTLIAYFNSEPNIRGYVLSIVICLSLSVPIWVITRKSRKVNHGGVLGQSQGVGKNFGSYKKYTYSYEYVGLKNK